MTFVPDATLKQIRSAELPPLFLKRVNNAVAKRTRSIATPITNEKHTHQTRARSQLFKQKGTTWCLNDQPYVLEFSESTAQVQQSLSALMENCTGSCPKFK